jgi:hypothetical protein
MRCAVAGSAVGDWRAETYRSRRRAERFRGGDGGGFATRFEYLRPPFPLRLLLSATLLAHGRRRVIAAGACTVEIHTRTGTVGNNR